MMLFYTHNASSKFL